MFQEIEAPRHYDEYDDVPIEGSIHAHDVRSFSQVTLSQFSDGPSVRSFRSQHRRASPTASQRIGVGSNVGSVASSGPVASFRLRDAWSESSGVEPPGV